MQTPNINICVCTNGNFYNNKKHISLKGDVSNVGSELRKVLADVKQRNENLSGREDKSPCSKVKDIENIMLLKLEQRISQLSRIN